jgi:hypothetical protein
MGFRICATASLSGGNSQPLGWRDGEDDGNFRAEFVRSQLVLTRENVPREKSINE